ncbi:MAG: hypothetical protein K1X28_07360 [Parachlamydiales bacterium]|nr:hypothetical protein [Parachlamydiales bacterium]
MYKKILEKLLSFPRRGQIQINFDSRKKIFRLTAPIFSSGKMPGKIKEYVQAREKLTFKPHVTSYEIQGEKVFLVQEIPFSLDFQETTRKDVDQFLELSRHCHKMLSEIAIEDVYKNALRL